MGDQAQKPQELPLLRTFKDSVFTDLFSRKEYTLQLYRSLHPEDTTACEDDIEIVTVQNVLTTDQHNDLGFIVGDRLLVLVEAQSTWSPNIVLRALLYAAQTLKSYVRQHGLDVYGAAPVPIPAPELYVVYTGDKRNVPESLALSEALPGWENSGIDARIRVIKDPGTSIAGQYIGFAKTMDHWRTICGSSEETVRRGIAECIAQGILPEYLKKHEEEVVDIMITLYDEREVLQNYVNAQVREASAAAAAESRAKGMAEGRAEGRAEGIVSTCKDLGASAEYAAAKLVERLGMSQADAEALVESLW